MYFFFLSELSGRRRLPAERTLVYVYTPDLYDLYGLAHVAGWEPYKLQGQAHVPWVGSAPFRPDHAQQPITTRGMLGSRGI